MSSWDVVVVGAGAAGLAASTTLREAGLSVLLLEAGPRIGGRALTTTLAGAPFDHGATWLHAAHRNPLVTLARAAGHQLADDEAGHHHALRVGGRAASAAELAALQATEAALQALDPADPRASLAEAAAGLRGDPWLDTVLTWEAAIIAAADAPDLSYADWRRNLLEGANLVPASGVGGLVAAIGQSAGSVRCNMPVNRIAWQERGGVSVDTPSGTLRARACIVTVSTGVLAAGAIRFSPGLPPVLEQAIQDLPMGLLTKLGFASGAARFDLPESCTVQRRVGPGEPSMAFNIRPEGRAQVTGFVGGRTAWALSGDPDATLQFARAELVRALGYDARLDGSPVGTDWGAHSLFRGAYAYAVPDVADPRAVLATPLADGRLAFAGEATRTDGLAGTVGGAWLAGQEAALAMTTALGGTATAALEAGSAGNPGTPPPASRS